jgi:uncharacterized protein YxeA
MLEAICLILVIIQGAGLTWYVDHCMAERQAKYIKTQGKKRGK